MVCVLNSCYLQEAVQKIPSGHREFISDTAFDYYGKRLVSASADGYIRIWNLINKEWTLQSEIKAHSSLISRVDWAHPIFGQIFAACLHNDIVVVYQEVIGEDKRKTWTRCCEILPPSSFPLDIAFCPRFNGLCLVCVCVLYDNQAICCKDGSVYIYKPTDAFQIRDWHLDSSFQINKQVNCLSWCQSRDQPPSLVVGTDDDAQIWEMTDVHTWEQRIVLSENNGIIRNVAWSNSIGKDYETIATACSVNNFLSVYMQDGCIRIFKMSRSGTNTTCSMIACLQDHGREVSVI